MRDLFRALVMGLLLAAPFFALEYAHGGASARRQLLSGLTGRAGVLWAALWLLPAALMGLLLTARRAALPGCGAARRQCSPLPSRF